MKTTVTKHDFCEAFRAIRPNNFTYAGLEALFEDMEQYEDDCGTEIELDVIAICCDYTQYTVEELQSEFPDMAVEIADTGDPDDIEDWLEALPEKTSVIGPIVDKDYTVNFNNPTITESVILLSF